jgi:putative CocE/NonD family hydrolase
MPAVERRPRILPRQVVKADDGAELCTDVYLPEADAARPVVLVRTPYGRSVPLLMQIALQLAGGGFCAVLQDCRGRYRSTGAYDLNLEATDTRASLRWLAGQPWSNGRVGLVGISISSLPNQMVASTRRPGEAEVCALVDIMGAVDYHRMCYRQGALVHHWTLPWTAMMGSTRGIHDWRGLDWKQLFRHRPLVEAAARTGADDWLWRMVVSNPAYGGFWEELAVPDHLGGVSAPVLRLSGWLDFMLDQTLLGHAAGVARRGAERGEQRLVIGPWDHRSLFAMTASTAATAAPTAPAESALSLQRTLGWWFDRWLAGGRGSVSSPLAGRPDVLLYVMSADRWIGAGEFPPREAATERWYLASDGQAGRNLGGGRLERAAPRELGADGFDYDPADPVPTLGGAVWPFPPADLAPLAADQSPVEARADVLVYTGEPLAADLAVVGPIVLELWAATSACDTDFTAKLVDVDPRGAARWVQDGIVRGRFHRDRRREELLEPQRPYRFEISLGATAHLFRAGHRLRLEVSSSNFPKFDHHLNTGGPLHTAGAAMVARQSVFHGAAMASCLNLPVLPADGLEALGVDLV